jgi:hypothetical protein
MNEDRRRQIARALQDLLTQLKATQRRYAESFKELLELERALGKTGPLKAMMAAFDKLGKDLPGDAPNLDELKRLLWEIRVMKACRQMAPVLKKATDTLAEAIERLGQ